MFNVHQLTIAGRQDTQFKVHPMENTHTHTHIQFLVLSARHQDDRLIIDGPRFEPRVGGSEMSRHTCRVSGILPVQERGKVFFTCLLDISLLHELESVKVVFHLWSTDDQSKFP